MRHTKQFRFANLAACTIALGGFAAGCNKNEPVEDSPAETAKQAVGFDNQEGKAKTITSKRDVLVEKTTKVVDQETGDVISTKKEVTPVTIEKEKTVDTDVNVNVGDTKKTVD